eukprot:gene3779-2670_t
MRCIALWYPSESVCSPENGISVGCLLFVVVVFLLFSFHFFLFFSFSFASFHAPIVLLLVVVLQDWDLRWIKILNPNCYCAVSTSTPSRLPSRLGQGTTTVEQKDRENASVGDGLIWRAGHKRGAGSREQKQQVESDKNTRFYAHSAPGLSLIDTEADAALAPKIVKEHFRGGRGDDRGVHPSVWREPYASASCENTLISLKASHRPKVGKSLHIRDGSEADERGAQRGEGEGKGEVHPADPSAKEEGQKTKQKNSSPATQQAQDGCWRLPSSSSLARSLSSLSVLSPSVAHSGRCSRETSSLRAKKGGGEGPMAQDVCVCGIGTHYWKRGEDFGSWLVSLSHPLVSGGALSSLSARAPRQGK